MSRHRDDIVDLLRQDRAECERLARCARTDSEREALWARILEIQYDLDTLLHGRKKSLLPR